MKEYWAALYFNPRVTGGFFLGKLWETQERAEEAGKEETSVETHTLLIGVLKTNVWTGE